MHATALRTLAMTVVPGELPRVRRALTRWLIDGGVTELTACDIVLVVTEAALDAAAHGPERITVTATRHVGQVVATVTDDGRWRDPDTGLGTLRGRGLAMLEAATERYGIAHTADRTTLTATFRLEAP